GSIAGTREVLGKLRIRLLAFHAWERDRAEESGGESLCARTKVRIAFLSLVVGQEPGDGVGSARKLLQQLHHVSPRFLLTLSASIQIRTRSSRLVSAAAMRLAKDRPMPRVPLQIAATVEYGIPKATAVFAAPPWRSTYSFQ
ncbi:hypothetical protein, partial [Xanthomonas euvesicatoria]